jgi:hypothetical protein
MTTPEKAKEKNNINLLDRLRSNKVLVFLIKAFLLYLCWVIIYEYLLKRYTRLDIAIIDNIINASSFVLEKMGYALIQYKVYDVEMRTMGIDGSHGLWIGDPCNGLTLFALFTGFILI